MNQGVSILFAFLLIFFFNSCEKTKEVPEEEKYGKIRFRFEHRIDGARVIQDTLIYTNTAGNQYLITEVKYFISDITFYPKQGPPVMICEWEDIFYVDEDIPSTHEQLFLDKIPVGAYDSLNFIFGITAEKNKSFMYVNPPEVNMFWPEVLGGGYHYMMINGKWKNLNGAVLPFDFHLGIGQLYKGEEIITDSIYAFVQNYFTVHLPNSAFEITAGDTLDILQIMNIESWFETPYIYDHNQWGGDIMQRQPAMEMARENGRDVFTCEILE